MPIVPPAPPATPTANQITLTAAVPTAQQNRRGMIGQTLLWNPDCPPDLVKVWINNAYRRVIDSRSWYGLLTRAQVQLPNVYSTGQVTVTQNSAVVTGTGTAWTTDMIGRSFRVGRTTYGPYLILDVPDPTHLTLDMPWGFANFTLAGYTIQKNIVSFGTNVKFIKSAYNPQVGWRLWVNMPQDVISVSDPWRAAIGPPWCIASFTPSAAGGPQYELYPMPITQQAIPALVYIQPPDLNNDTDTPYTFIRSDIIVYDAIKTALLFRGPKQNKYYDANTAAYYEKLFQAELNKMSMTDDNLATTDLRWEFAKAPLASPGMDWAQMHEETPGAWGDF